MLGVMNIDKLSRIQTEANNLLQGAILSERGRNWNKVAEKYKKLLKLISKNNLPHSLGVPASYNMLLYESYYHLGVALQQLGRHRESVYAYTSAMTAMNLRKNGCLAGCSSNTCFQTPVLAKRAFAHSRTGDIKSGFRDIEKAVVLDTRNPDLYCLRALLWSTRKETQKALEDLNRALTFDPSHVAALILRGTIDHPVQMSFGLLEGLSLNLKKEVSKDHQMASKLNPDASGFLDVRDVHHPKIIMFWNRFLRCLNVPRTVNHVDLMSTVLAQYNTTIAMSQNVEGKISVSTEATPLAGNQSLLVDLKRERPKSMPQPFRCGTPHSTEDGHKVRIRRLSYGQALRTYNAKRQDTGVSEYIQRLVAHASRPTTAKQNLDPERTSVSITRSPSPALLASRSNSRKSSINYGNNQVPANSHSNSPDLLRVPTICPPLIRRKSNISIASCPTSFNRNAERPKSQSSKSLSVTFVTPRRASIAAMQKNHLQAASLASSMHGIEVFNPVNVSDAPRMYYKPWGGDKLPVAELPGRRKVEAFRV